MQNHARIPVVIVTGGTGAGKTTHALRMAEELGAVRFSADDWLKVLFEADRLAEADYTWYAERHHRLEQMIREVASQLLAVKTPVVLDLGFTERTQRVAAANWATLRGGTPHIHYVNVDAELRWQRIGRRNRQRGATFAMEVTREMFNFMEQRFQIPSDDEAPITVVP